MHQILELIGYPKSIITQIQFAQKYGNINEALEEAMNYLKQIFKLNNEY